MNFDSILKILTVALLRSLKNLCEAHSHIGIRRLTARAREVARAHFRKSVPTGVHSYFEFQRTEIFLARMEQAPNWPSWLPRKTNADRPEGPALDEPGQAPAKP